MNLHIRLLLGGLGWPVRLAGHLILGCSIDQSGRVITNLYINMRIISILKAISHAQLETGWVYRSLRINKGMHWLNCRAISLGSMVEHLSVIPNVRSLVGQKGHPSHIDQRLFGPLGLCSSNSTVYHTL